MVFSTGGHWTGPGPPAPEQRERKGFRSLLSPWGCLGPGAEAASDQGMHLLLCAPSSAPEEAKLSKFTGPCEGGLEGGGEGA